MRIVTLENPSIIFLLAGIFILGVVILTLLRARARDPLRILDAYQSSNAIPSNRIKAPVTGSMVHRARLVFGRFKIDVSGRERLSLTILYLILVGLLYPILITIIHLPVMIAGAGAMIAAAFVVQVLLGSAWDRMRREIEKDIPTLMIRLSGMIQASPNVLESLDEVTKSLDSDRPLYTWMRGLVVETQERGISAFDELERDAEMISSSLILAVVQIRRLWESGGSGYIKSFRLIADHLSELMNTRALAYAKSGRSGNLARIIIAAAVISLSGIMNNPTSRAMFMSNPVTRLGLVAFFVWGGFGWFYIRSILRSVTT